MVGKTKTPTKAQKVRFQKLQDLGCIVCLNQSGAYRAPDVHHIIDCGRRMGHDYTIPLCPYHHRGVVSDPAEVYLGPSLADGKRPFESCFGTQLQLLQQVNDLIGESEK